MRGTFLVASLIVALVPSMATARIVRATGIPQAYWGTWATSAGSCAADKGAIVLDGKTYVGPSGNCTVIYVDVTPGAAGSIYSARLLCAAPAAGARKTAANVIIRPDKDGISLGPTFDGLVAYQRCPSSAAGVRP